MFRDIIETVYFVPLCNTVESRTVIQVYYRQLGLWSPSDESNCARTEARPAIKAMGVGHLYRAKRGQTILNDMCLLELELYMLEQLYITPPMWGVYQG